MDKKIGCAILAGGKSQRMGQDKALLEYQGEKFIERICKEFAFFSEKYIARGANPDCFIEGWKVIEDIYKDKGPIGGIHAVLSCCKADAMFFTTCDMPFLTGELSKLLCESLKENVDAVIAVTADGRWHPLCGVYRKSMVSIFKEQILSGNNRMQSALDKMRVICVRIDEKDAPQLQNINTKKEYLELK